MSKYLTPNCAVRQALNHLLDALDVSATVEPIVLESIGCNALLAPDQAVVLIAADDLGPVPLHALIASVGTHHLDAIVVRREPASDGSVSVRCDVILAALPCDPFVLLGFEAWAQDGATWLVDRCAGHAIRVSSDGLELVLGQPFLTPGQWRSGLLRAQGANALEGFAEVLV